MVHLIQFANTVIHCFIKHSILLACVFCFGLIHRANSQPAVPEVIFQTGFSINILSEFKFSPGGNYLVGFSQKGEYVLWDIKTGKQVKKLVPFGGDEIKLFYGPHFAMSNNDRLMLLPLLPKGEYILYDVIQNKTKLIFKPEDPDEYYTNALFSADASRILLIGQKPGEKHFCEVVVFTREGKLIRRTQLNLPLPVFQYQALLRILVGKALAVMAQTAFVDEVVADDDLEHLYFSMSTGGIYAVDLTEPTSFYSNMDLMHVKGLAKTTHGILSVYKDKLMIEGERRFSKRDSLTQLTDTIFVVNRKTLTVEKEVYPRYLTQRKKLRSGAISTLPITVSQNMGVYLDYWRSGLDDIEIIGKDVITEKELFRYKRGDPIFYSTTSTYRPAQLNGGYVVAISPDGQQMIECSRDLVVHQLSKKIIKTVIPAARGQMRLGTPVFLDSTTVLLPKPYSDGFIFDMKNGNVNRLKREIDYQDTTNGGGNAYYSFDYSQQIGIQHANLVAGGKTLVTTNVVPNGFSYNKEITVWDVASRLKIVSHIYQDREYAYFINGLPNYPKRFMVNYKLVNFDQPDKPIVTPLYIIHKRDTFYAVNPVYFPAKKQIIGITGTRSKKGHPDLIFAIWNVDGKLLNSYRVTRERGKLEYPNLIYESQISPDSTKILFGLYDGIAGIYDIEKHRVTSKYEHGHAYGTTYIAGNYGHTPISSACFVDNQHFISNGSDGRLFLWTIGNPEPRQLNEMPYNVLGMSVSPDKKYLVATDYDKTVHFINLATGSADVTFAAGSGEAWCMVNNQRYYMSNKKSNNDISFFYDGKAYEFAQFDVLMHRPDEILNTLGYATATDIDQLRRARQTRIANLNYQPFRETYNAPEIEIKGLPEQLYDIAQPVLNFKILATDRFSTVDRLFITVNGIPFYGVTGLKIKALKKANLVTLPVALPLATGKNQIIISVKNAQGAESLQQSLNVSRMASAVKPNLYLVAIGASQYEQAGRNLNYPVKDARDFLKLFLDKRSNYNQVFIDTLFDQKVSLSNLGRLKTRLKTSRTDDMVIIYYCGHGLVRNLNYYLATYRTNFNTPERSSIPFENLENLVDSIPSRNRLMLIDACNSGARAKDGKSNQQDFQLMQTLFSDLRRSTGASEICASGPAERALEIDKLENGVFMHFLKKGLRNMEADLNKNGNVSVSELAEYLSTAVSAFTIRNQEPTLRTQNIVNDMAIWQ